MKSLSYIQELLQSLMRITKIFIAILKKKNLERVLAFKCIYFQFLWSRFLFIDIHRIALFKWGSSSTWMTIILNDENDFYDNQNRFTGTSWFFFTLFWRMSKWYLFSELLWFFFLFCPPTKRKVEPWKYEIFHSSINTYCSINILRWRILFIIYTLPCIT